MIYVTFIRIAVVVGCQLYDVKRLGLLCFKIVKRAYARMKQHDGVFVVYGKALDRAALAAKFFGGIYEIHVFGYVHIYLIICCQALRYLRAVYHVGATHLAHGRRYFQQVP